MTKLFVGSEFTRKQPWRNPFKQTFQSSVWNYIINKLRIWRSAKKFQYSKIYSLERLGKFEGVWSALGGVLKNFPKIHRKTPVPESFCENCKNFEENRFYRTPLVTAFAFLNLLKTSRFSDIFEGYRRGKLA